MTCSRVVRAGSWVVPLLAAACTGQIDQEKSRAGQGATGSQSGARPGSPGPAPGAPPGAPTGSATPGVSSGAAAGGPTCASGPRPGPAPLRRLTAREYDNTVRELLGNTSALGVAFSGHAARGFENDVSVLGVDRVLAQALAENAERLAAAFIKKLPGALTCDPAMIGEDACARTFLETFGLRAFRRPLDAAELGLVTSAFTRWKSKYGFVDAVRMSVEYFLQSPRFLYRVETGQPPAASESVVRLTPWEIASRLSFLLWSSMPDAALFEAARSGKLATPAQVAEQARRMLKDPRARDLVTYFADQWLDLGELDQMDRSRTTFPKYAPTLNPLLRGEIEQFIDDVVWQGKGDLGTLLSASHSFVNDKLAAFYGMPAITGGELKRVSLDPQQRPGLLTRGGLMALLSHRKATSPVKRGMFVRTALLCSPPPPPPPEVDSTISEQDMTLTARAQLANHEKIPSCAGCHKLIDAIGLGLENYDAVGLWRSTEAGAPVNASGEVTGTDIAGPFVGAVELTRKLASSRQVSDCMATHWFRLAAGRAETDADACSLAGLHKAFADAGGSIPELIVALTQTDAFLYKAAGGAP